MPIGILFAAHDAVIALFHLRPVPVQAEQKPDNHDDPDLMLFILLGLVGWKLFGPVLQ